MPSLAAQQNGMAIRKYATNIPCAIQFAGTSNFDNCVKFT